jgi:4-hydroxy-3-methylbut-2-enyl diphosphate reductase
MAVPALDPARYVRKGFGLKTEVQATLAADYDGRLVDLLPARDNTLAAGGVTVRLAREFGFCYGVERPVDYAYQTRSKFPDRRVWLAGEIIHNPHVNARLREMGVGFLADGARRARHAGVRLRAVRPEDVVILPAFGVTIHDFAPCAPSAASVVDTTCGSVLNVWKRVEAYARDGFTALIHGKYYHEETRATASQVQKHANGHYLVVRDMAEAELVCDYVAGRGDRAAFLGQVRPLGLARLRPRAAPRARGRGQPDHDARPRVAGHRRARGRRHGAGARRRVPRRELPLVRHDLLGHAGPAGRRERAAPGAARRDGRGGRLQLEQHDVARRPVRRAGAHLPHREPRGHRRGGRHGALPPAGAHTDEATRAGWLPAGPVRVGLTAGASTPNSKIGETVARLFAMRGVDAAALTAEADAALADAARADVAADAALTAAALAPAPIA